MNKNIKKISTLALSVSITACGFGQCGCAQHFVPPTPVANRVMPRGPITPVPFRMDEKTPAVPGTPMANRDLRRTENKPGSVPFPNLDEFADEPTNLDEFPAVQTTPLASRVMPSFPLTPVLLPVPCPNFE